MHIEMLSETVAPCGLVCGLCKNTTPEKGSCPGCKSEGGDAKCHQRLCTREKQLTGCWECGEFPCDNGFFAKSDHTWRGLCVGSIQRIKQHGVDAYLQRLVSRVGNVVEYGDYRFKTPEEIARAFCGKENT